MTTTTNFANFGYREREIAAELLNASIAQGFPADFYDEKVTIMFNRSSGSVFFTNSEYQVCMMNGEDLEMWHFTPYAGHEGFADELKEMLDDSWNHEDVEYLRDNDIITEDEYEAWLDDTPPFDCQAQSGGG